MSLRSDLIKKLRKCSSQERISVAIELAKTGTDKGIRELIRMVEGRRRYLLSWYDLDDQLIGIEALGETRKKEALEYLEKVYTTLRKSHGIETVVAGGGSEPRDDNVYTISFEVYHYPLARPSLGESLSSKKLVSVSEEYYGNLSEDDWPSCVSAEAPKDKRAHQVFQKSIAGLRLSFEK